MTTIPPIRLWFRAGLLAVLLGAGGLGSCDGQGRPEAGVQTLLDKAHGLELARRMDLAALTWQQVLLVDPGNPQATAGLARAAKAPRPPAEPERPQVERAESQRAQLEEAAALAAAGQYGQAMAVYHGVFGQSPPPGEYAVAFYETQAATEAGRAHALLGLRALVRKNPGDARFQIALARILTYSSQTRSEGRRLLARYPRDPGAVEALRQSLLWDAQNPASTADVRNYLALHPDPQLARSLGVEPGTTSEPVEPRSTAPQPGSQAEEQAAFRYLHTGRIGEAELRFKAILERHPSSGAALAGMGYIRMQQGNFGGALSFLTQAKQAGIEDASLDTALDTSRFWFTMGEGQSALAENDLATAEKQFESAVAMRPTSPDALDGLGSALLKARKPEAATQLYERFTAAQPNAPAAWRGLVQARFASDNAAAALATERRIPSAVHVQLMRDPLFLQTLAAASTATGQDEEAQRFLDAALDLPSPTGAQEHPGEAQLQYAGLLLQAKRFDQAESVYRQVLAANPANAPGIAPAWVGLIRVQHLAGKDDEAMRTLESLPPAVYAAASRDPAFDSTIATLFAGQGRLDTAQDVLEKSLSQQTAAKQTLSAPLQIQLAGIYLQRNRSQLAFGLYRQVLTEHPNRLEAWMSLLTTLHTTRGDAEALAQLQQISPAVRLQLEADPAYLETVAAIYSALGQPREASVFLGRVEQVYALRHLSAPPDIELQNASLLFRSADDSALYTQLMALDSRTDLSEAQRHALQIQWGSWALRRADQASGAGDPNRAVALLDATANAFPENHDVLEMLPAGYARAGQPRRAVALFQKQDLKHVPAATCQAAIAAALAVSDRRQAESWLGTCLAVHPDDPDLLLFAARAAQSHGRSRRAADLYRASLDASPDASLDASRRSGDKDRVGSGGSSPGGSPRMHGLAALLAPGAGSAPPVETRAPLQIPAAPEPPSPPINGSPISSLPAPFAPRLKNASTMTSDGSGQVPPLVLRRTGSDRRPADTIYGPYTPYMPLGQSDANARTGQSHPPGDDLPVMARHASQSLSSDSRQIPRPSQPLPPLLQAGQYGDSQGQQYPRPRRSPPAAAHRRPARAASHPAALAKVPSPTVQTQPTITGSVTAEVPVTTQPQLPAMSYPSLAQLGIQPALSAGTVTAPIALPPAGQSGSSREQAAVELASLEASYTGSIATTGLARLRTGTPGLDRLTDLETPTEISVVLANSVRAAIIPRAVFLNSGTSNPTALQGGVIPILGTRPTNLLLPHSVANGVGGEAQLVTENYGVAIGYTPDEFLVPNLTARLRLRPYGGPVTLLAERQPVTQTQLSYAGLRDPAAPANIWGGVVSTGASLRLDFGDPRGAISFVAHGATLTGRHVEQDTAFSAAVAARFRLHAWPRAGALTLGAALDASHFTHNERGLSFGQGGYFSPNYYVLAAAPVTFSGQLGTSLHYRISAAGGVQTYQERPAAFFPLDAALQRATCAFSTPACGYPLRSDTSAYYAVDATGAYRIGGHWLLGAFLSANNTNLYDQVSTGFFVRYLFTPQIPLADIPTGLFPIEGLLPLRVP